MNIIKNVLTFVSLYFLLFVPAYAVTNTQSDVLSFTVPSFTRIASVTSPVLTANITNRTGNLYTPMSTRFRVITNSANDKTLYLKAKVVTSDGYEDAMFEQGGQVYIAFTNLVKKPTTYSLMNCKMGGVPKDSPGVVAYPVTSITGPKNMKFMYNKYEVTVGSGTTDVTVNVGSNVLRSSFAANDPKGFYQAVLSLTEADI